MSLFYKKPDGYYCTNCNRGLDPEETHLSYDDVLTCKRCGSEDVVEAFACDICGNLTPDDDLAGYGTNVCWNCIEKKRYDLDFCAKVGDAGSGLNGFLSSFFSETEMNELMMEALKERAKLRLVDGWDYLKKHGYEAAEVLREENG